MPHAFPAAVPQVNLEDPRDEMDRRIIAAMQHHRVSPDEIAGRLFVDTGRECALSTAIQTREGVQIIKPEIDALAAKIEARGIDVLVIDPFVSSLQASENDNGAIDFVVVVRHLFGAGWCAIWPSAPVFFAVDRVPSGWSQSLPCWKTG